MHHFVESSIIAESHSMIEGHQTDTAATTPSACLSQAAFVSSTTTELLEIPAAGPEMLAVSGSFGKTGEC